MFPLYIFVESNIFENKYYHACTFFPWNASDKDLENDEGNLLGNKLLPIWTTTAGTAGIGPTLLNLL